jgi:ABC-type transport system substrate-binding protein
MTLRTRGRGVLPLYLMPLALFVRQARELDRKKREELLHQIQRILHERVVYAPIWENGFIRGVGPRVEEGALTLIPAFPYSAPAEELPLKRP